MKVPLWLFYEIVGVIRGKCVQGWTFAYVQPGFPSEQLFGILDKFPGEGPDMDVHGAGRLAGTAVGAPSGTVKGPEKMKGFDVGVVLPFAHPLGIGFIHKTGGAIAQWAGIAAGITADAALQQIVK